MLPKPDEYWEVIIDDYKPRHITIEKFDPERVWFRVGNGRLVALFHNRIQFIKRIYE